MTPTHTKKATVWLLFFLMRLRLLLAGRKLGCRSSCGSFIYYDSGLILCGSLFAGIETHSCDAEENDEGDERPSCFLQEVSRTRCSHYLVAACKTGSQSATLAVLNQYKQRQQYGSNNN